MKKSGRGYTVIGAGNGGKAMAAHLALMGFEVTLYNRTSEKLPLSRHGVVSHWKAKTLLGPGALVN